MDAGVEEDYYGHYGALMLETVCDTGDGGSARMNSKNVLAGFAILFVTPLGQQPLQRERDPNSMIAFHGGSGSHLLPACQAALKIGTGGNKTVMIKPTATDIQDAVDGSFCRGYVLGVVDALIATSVTTETAYCIPTSADSDQFVGVVAKYLNDNPAKLNEPAGLLVAKSMVDAFPCK
jgi:hypothetical protein